jgi:hypothetical protein
MPKLLFDRVNETKFRKLKFGNDSPGYGDSSQPFIQTPLPSTKAEPFNIDQINIAGLLDTKTDDLKRITKFLKTPSGKKFILNQVGLQLANPQLEKKQQQVASFLDNIGFSSNSVVDSIDSFLDSNPTPNNTRIYNGGINTLAQVAVQGSGLHFKRHGLTPLENKSLLYENVVKENNEAGKNRLVKLVDKFGIGIYEIDDSIGPNPIGFLDGFIGELVGKIIPKLSTSKKISKERIINEYSGGPDSTFGIGNTVIKSYTNTNDAENIYENGLKDITLFRLSTRNNLSRLTFPLSNKINNQIDPSDYINGGKSVYNKNIGNIYDDIKAKQEDQKKKLSLIPASPTFTNNPNTPPTYIYNVDTFEPKDIIIDRGNKDFKYLGDTSALSPRIDDDNMVVIFEVFHPFNNTSNRISYSAYIKGYRNASNSSWNATQYAGRSEEVLNFRGFSREVSFTLQVPNFNPVQLRENHRKTGQLESSLAGFYNNNNVLGSILTKVYLGKYLYGEPGVITNLSYTVPDDVDWDVDEMLAHYITMDVSFKLIHKNAAQYNLYSDEPWVEGGGFLEATKNAGKGFTTLKNSQLNKYSNAGLRSGGGIGEGKYIDTIQRKDLKQ